MNTFLVNAYHLIVLFSLVSTAATPFTATSYEPMHQSLPVPVRTNGSTSIAITGTQTSGHKAYDGAENSVPFLEQYGTIAVKDLITGLDSPAAGTTTYKYLHASGAKSITTKDATLRFNSTDNNYSFNSTTLSLTQHLFTGLFAQIHTQLTSQSLAQAPSAEGPDATDSNVANFLLDLDTILGEYGLPALTTNKRATTLERLTLLLGWSGHTHLHNSVFEEMGGSLSAGYVVTPPAFNHPLAPAALSYNISDGFVARVTGHAQISPYIAADIDASTTVYTQRNGTMHVVRDDTQGSTWYAGPLLLGTGFVKKDPGSLWDLHFRLSVNRLKGFSFGLGYSFAYQEATQLEVKDSTLLRGAGWTGSKLFELPALQKTRLNSDPRLLSWKHHAATVTASFEPTHIRSRLMPHFTFSMFFPLLGHRSSNPGSITSGGGRIAMQWNL